MQDEQFGENQFVDEGYVGNDGFDYPDIVPTSLSPLEFYEKQKQEAQDLRTFQEHKREYCFAVKMCLFSIDAYIYGTISYADFKLRVTKRFNEVENNPFGRNQLRNVLNGALDDAWNWDIEADYYDLFSFVYPDE